MIRTLIAVSAAVAALISTSCCCTGDPAPPKLRRLPYFHPMPTADAPTEVIPTK